MFYTLSPALREISLQDVSPQQLCVGYLTGEELAAVAAHLGYPGHVVAECLGDQDKYRNTVDVYESFTFGIVTFVNPARVYEASDRLAFFLQPNLLLWVSLRDLDKSSKAVFEQALLRLRPETATLEKLLYALLENSISKDAQTLAQWELEISALEESLFAQGKTPHRFQESIFTHKRRLLLLQDYYEQLIDVGEELQENENDIFAEGTLHYFALFSAKAGRLMGTVQRLLAELNELRAAHQAALDYAQNRIMKIFTVITSVFLPLTLIVGWYGMNFTYMPELDWQMGYPFVFVLSLVTVLVCLLFFKKKNLL